MKVTFETEELRAAVEALKIATARNKTGAGQWARMRTTRDAETGELCARAVARAQSVAVEHRAVAVAGDEGEWALPVDKLAAIVGRNAPGAKITLRSTGSVLHMTCGTYRSRTPELLRDALPGWVDDPAAPADAATFEQPSLLAGLLKRVEDSIFTKSAERAHYGSRKLPGAFFLTEDGRLSVYATDGNRVSRASLETPAALRFIVDEQAVSAMIKVLDAAASPATLAVVGAAAFVTTERTRLKMMTIDERGTVASSVDALFRLGWEQAFSVDARALLHSVKRLLLFAEDTRIDLAIGHDALALRGASAAEGDASEQLACERRGEEATLKLRARYLTDALNRAERVSVDYIDDRQPVRVRHHDDDYATEHVLAQMR